VRTGKRNPVSTSLRAAIQECGLTLYRLAKESGVDAAVLGRFVKNERDLNLQTADRICNALGLELRPTKREVKR